MNKPIASINKAVLAPAQAMFDLKFHQVAIYIDDIETGMNHWRSMGFTDWSVDRAVLVGVDNGVPGSKVAHMAFNYDIMPLELEYVSYSGPRNSMDTRDGSVPFLSHLSTMVDELGPVIERMERQFGMRPYHTFQTHDHTNPHVRLKKRFNEAIYNTAPQIGFDIKLIERIPW